MIKVLTLDGIYIISHDQMFMYIIPKCFILKFSVYWFEGQYNLFDNKLYSFMKMTM